SHVSGPLPRARRISVVQRQRSRAPPARSFACSILGRRRRLSLPRFKLLRPRSVAEALEYLGKHGGELRVLAGGTDLIPSMKQRLFEPEYVLDLRGVAEMRGIRRQPDRSVEIGALTAIRSIERSELLNQHYPVLAEAAATVASPVLRNMGTIGGNI